MSCLRQDLWRFYAFSLVIQLILFLVGVAMQSNTGNQAPTDAARRFFDTISAAAPIGGPTVVAFANMACVHKLKKQGIDVLSPAKLRVAAAVNVVCFDKTGTLTGSVVSGLPAAHLLAYGRLESVQQLPVTKHCLQHLLHNYCKQSCVFASCLKREPCCVCLIAMTLLACIATAAH